VHDNRVALVTGANQAVGLQVAKELAAHGLTVLVGSRNFGLGEAAAKEIGPGAVTLQLDVTDGDSIVAAAERIRREIGRLDLLVNNAGISKTTQGSSRHPSNASLIYPASKTALNAMTLAMMIELESTDIKVNLVSPGFTKTNLNGCAGTESVEDGSREVVRVALLGPDGPTGTFT
jgi:NAD(P)-dependent dehydrogenase (short-subunit alcohol dehydrogenase family)